MELLLVKQKPQIKLKGMPLEENISLGSFAEINSQEFLQALKSEKVLFQKAFRKLVINLTPKITQFLRRYLSHEETIQDALQETFLGVHRGLKRFEGKCKLSTWIYSLAYRKACDALAQKYRYKNFEMENIAFEEVWEISDTRELPIDEMYFQNKLVNNILKISNQLPKIYRDVYQLRDLDGVGGEDAAEILGISETLIRVRLHRARGLIVERLGTI